MNRHDSIDARALSLISTFYPASRPLTCWVAFPPFFPLPLLQPVFALLGRLVQPPCRNRLANGYRRLNRMLSFDVVHLIVQWMLGMLGPEAQLSSAPWNAIDPTFANTHPQPISPHNLSRPALPHSHYTRQSMLLYSIHATSYLTVTPCY
ncbi:MAG: hypothetical protein J3Q66DRAFT_353517 [Benniella sp.]|nr:MAG: hypothetical protein J3Q66DRAFT_353517 [Benniella sp.]